MDYNLPVRSHIDIRMHGTSLNEDFLILHVRIIIIANPLITW